MGQPGEPGEVTALKLNILQGGFSSAGPAVIPNSSRDAVMKYCLAVGRLCGLQAREHHHIRVSR